MVVRRDVRRRGVFGVDARSIGQDVRKKEANHRYARWPQVAQRSGAISWGRRDGGSVFNRHSVRSRRQS